MSLVDEAWKIEIHMAIFVFFLQLLAGKKVKILFIFDSSLVRCCIINNEASSFNWAVIVS